MSAVYIKRIETTHEMFRNRATVIMTSDGTGPLKEAHRIPIDDTEVICNGCNGNFYPNPMWGVYFGRANLARGHMYAVYCDECVTTFKNRVEVK